MVEVKGGSGAAGRVDDDVVDQPSVIVDECFVVSPPGLAVHLWRDGDDLLEFRERVLDLFELPRVWFGVVVLDDRDESGLVERRDALHDFLCEVFRCCCSVMDGGVCDGLERGEDVWERVEIRLLCSNCFLVEGCWFCEDADDGAVACERVFTEG